MKKRFGLVVLAVLLALACVLTFVACGGGSNDSGSGRRTEADGTYYAYQSSSLNRDKSLTVERGKITSATGFDMSNITEMFGDLFNTNISYSGSVDGKSVTFTITITFKQQDTRITVKVLSTMSGEYNNGVIHFTTMSEETVGSALGGIQGSGPSDEPSTKNIDMWMCKEDKTPADIEGGDGKPGETRPGSCNTFETAIAATVGTVYTVNISGGEGMWYSFTPTETGTFVIQSSDKRDGDPYVELFNSSHERLASNDDGANDGNHNFKLMYTFEAGTTYYVLVRDYSSGNSISCRFSISALPNSTRTDAIVLQSIDSFVADFIVSNQQIWYAYTPTTTDTYVFNSNSSANSLYIYRDREQTAFASHEVSNNNYTNLNLSCELEAGTTYYICCQRSNSDSQYTWEISVELSDGSSRDRALVAALDREYNVNIARGGDEVWFVFRPTVRGRYVIQSSDSTDDPYCVLYSGNSNSALTYDDNGAGGNDFRIVRVLEANTNYYILASMASAAGTGSYKFSVTAADGATRETAVLAQPDVDYTVAPRDGSPVWLEFTVSMDGDYVIRSTGNVGDPAFDLYADSDSSASYSGDIGGTGNNFSTTCTLEPNTTYYLAVKQLSSTAQGSYTVRIQSPAGTTRANPIGVVLGREYPVRVSDRDIDVWFTYTPAVSGTYVMRTVGSYSGDPDSNLFEGDSNDYLVRDDDGGESYNFFIRRELTAGTTYYIRAFDAESYTFVWEKADGASRTMAIIAAFNTPYQVNIADSAQEIWYTFTTTSSGEYTFTSNAVGSCDPICYLYNGNDSSAMFSDDNGGEGNNFRFAYNFSSNSTYYVRLKVVDGATGNFMFIVRRMDGTSREAALQLYTGDPTSVYVTTSNQSVWYSFTPVISGKYTFESVDGVEYDPNVKLYQDGNTTALGTNDNISADDKNFSLTYALTADTTYYLEVKNSLFPAYLNGHFGLRVTNLPGSSRDNPLVIDGNETYSVSITNPNAATWYSFTPTETTEYTIYSMSISGGCDPYVTVYQGNSTSSLATDNDGGVNSNFSLTLTLNAGTTYYIAAGLARGSSTGNYTLVITDGRGETRDNAIVASVGTSYTLAFVGGNSSTNSASQWLVFTPTVSDDYTLRSSDSTVNDPDMKVYIGDNTTSTDSLSHTDTGVINKTVTLTAGTTYYIELYGYHGNGSFTFTITRS